MSQRSFCLLLALTLTAGLTAASKPAAADGDFVFNVPVTVQKLQKLTELRTECRVYAAKAGGVDIDYSKKLAEKYVTVPVVNGSFKGIVKVAVTLTGQVNLATAKFYVCNLYGVFEGGVHVHASGFGASYYNLTNKKLSTADATVVGKIP